MVEVFKTNVNTIRAAKLIVEKLSAEFPAHKINFDLTDCDRILRVQGTIISGEKIIHLVTSMNYHCEVLH